MNGDAHTTHTMLLSVDITNYALIDKLRIDLEAGFTVITGETGAGKSIVLDALNLLLGQRADIKSIREGEHKCVIEGRFGIGGFGLEPFFEGNDLDYDDETILRREVYDTGKSRAFVNDVPVSLAVMRELGSRLVDIHSQNQNLQLGSEDFQTDMLDTVARDGGELQNLHEAYRSWKDADRELCALRERVERSRSEEEYLTFQLTQLQDARLRDGEQEELEQEQDMLGHAEEIKQNLYRAARLFASDDRGLLSDLRECCGLLADIGQVYAPAKELHARMESSLIELKDVDYELEAMSEDVEYNPERLQTVTDRLNLIYSLQQKHHLQTVAELLSLQGDMERKLTEITSADDRIDELQQRVGQLHRMLEERAAVVTARRKAAAASMQQAITDSLVELGMPNVRFGVEVSARTDIGLNGADNVCFLFSANKSTRLQPLQEVASGGELSRVMLAVKALAAQLRQMPVIVFDEIDTGVSGEIAARMAAMMESMSRNGRQVICITHLPQIAAKGTAHFRVYKQESGHGTVSRMQKLDHEGRVAEIAQMLSGTAVTEAALNNARTLLDNG